MNNGRAFEDYSEEDLYITRDESRLDDYEKQEMRQKKKNTLTSRKKEMLDQQLVH